MPAESSPTTCHTCRYTRLAPKSFNVVIEEIKPNWPSDNGRLANWRGGRRGGFTYYSGIQTPKNQKPHWLNPGSHTGVSS